MVRNSIFLLLFFSSGLFAQTDLDKCLNLLQRSEAMIKRQDSLINFLKEDIRLSDLSNSVIRKQNENSEITLRYLDIELKKEKRFKKVWQILAISGLTACLTATIIYIVN